MSDDIEMDKNQDGEYIVGYKKPPKNGQFQPGQSGNPKGRPKGSKNLVTCLSEELDTKVTVTENGKVIKFTKMEVIIKTLVNKAAKGDHKAIREVIRLNRELFPNITNTRIKLDMSALFEDRVTETQVKDFP